MLQRIEAEIDLARRIRMAVNGDDAALLAELVIASYRTRDQGTGIRDQRSEIRDQR
jgi:hypothetical protein